MLIIRPFKTPTSEPATSPAATASGTGAPFTISMADTSPAHAITEPTERSMPVVMITMHWPNALMAIQEKERRLLKMFVDVRNLSSPYWIRV